MVETLKIAALAILQGITEFLPVSSSGHLVLAKHFLGLQTPSGPFLEVVLHTGTLVSIAVYYRQRILHLVGGVLKGERESWRFAAIVVVASTPAILVYVLLGDSIEALFDRPQAAAAMLCVTGVLVGSLHWAPEGTQSAGPVSGLLMGMAQAAAMIPGISRSGSTIAVGRWLKLAPREAAEMSFLMVLPLLAGAAGLELIKALSGQGQAILDPVSLLLGFVLAAATGYAALALLVKLLADHRFYLFGLYCLAAGILAWVAIALTSLRQ